MCVCWSEFCHKTSFWIIHFIFVTQTCEATQHHDTVITPLLSESEERSQIQSSGFRALLLLSSAALLIAFTCCPRPNRSSTDRVNTPSQQRFAAWGLCENMRRCTVPVEHIHGQNVPKFKSVQSNLSQNLPSECISDFTDILLKRKKEKEAPLTIMASAPTQSQLHRLVQWHKVYSIWEQIGHAQ